MRTAARISVILLITALFAGGVAAGPASAHTTLTNANPAPDSTVRPPTSIVLTYADPVRFTEVLVSDAAGRKYQSGRTNNVDNTVTENVIPLPNGPYTVAWRAVAPDGHPVEGTYKFTVTGSTASTPTAAPAAADNAPASSSGSGSGTWWLVVFAVLIAAAVIGGFVLLRRPRADAGAGVDD